MRRLSEVVRSDDPRLLLGLDSPDDAAVYEIAPGLALIQTVDFFTPIVDDPFVWGEIAAANAMSDVYAMGGTPVLAMNLVGWPQQGLSFDLLGSVLEGAAMKAREAGVLIVGGHSLDDREPKFGLAVTGTADPSLIIRSSTARAGMHLVLTKPLGTGVIATAIKRDAAPPHLIEEAISVMTSLNAPAARAMIEAGAGAATDVTGFGLLGHLQQMADSSGVGAEVWAEEIPVLQGVRELVEQDLIPGGTRRNEAHFKTSVSFEEGLDVITQTVLFDAQTSGGLLIAVPEPRADALLTALRNEGTHAVSRVGVITDLPRGTIVVRRRP